jgi:quercetin 2,3-dioxygenase
MLTHYPYASLGSADYGWLKPRYHFSFASYRNPARTGFGDLLVVNDDIVAPKKGFDPHPHRDMEIITYVRSGSVTHRDSMGNEGVTRAGDVQVMSAGTGVTHSEYNLSDEPLTLYQIWIVPHTKGVAPSWDAREFPKTEVTEALPVLVSGMQQHAASDALYIHQDAAIYGGRMKAGGALVQPLVHNAYILISSGEVEVDGVRMQKGDGAEVTAQKTVALKALTDAEILVIDVKAYE